MHTTHEPYYHDRLTEWDLCHDFPDDAMYIDGLHAMQCHFMSHNVPVDIPVVRVMNAAHFMLAYAFSNECSGDQMEYDALAYGSVGHDKQVMLVTLIVLAAMLKRTEGFRAGMCRYMLLENRTDDFHEGVTLYDQFLRSAEKHFGEEDFLLDTHQQILRQQEEITRLTSENIQLKYTITTMEEKYQQINIGTQNVNYGTINNYYGFSPSSSSAASDNHPKEDSSFASDNLSDSSSSSLFCRITKAAYEKGVAQNVEDDLRSACVSAPKLVKKVKLNEALGYLDTEDLPSTDLYDLLNEHYHLPFKIRTFQDYRGK